MEIWDGYYADKTFAGIDMIREEEFGKGFPSGLYHLVSDVIVQHSDGTFLAMQRDFNKAGHPGEWELGAGGSVLKGESAEQGAFRELFEETGIKTERLTLVDTISKVHSNGVGVHYFVYICNTDVQKDSILLQNGETVAYKWVTKDEIKQGGFIDDRKYSYILEKM